MPYIKYPDYNIYLLNWQLPASCSSVYTSKALTDNILKYSVPPHPTPQLWRHFAWSQILFSGKNKKKYFSMSSAEFFTQNAKG